MILTTNPFVIFYKNSVIDFNNIVVYLDLKQKDIVKKNELL